MVIVQIELDASQACSVFSSARTMSKIQRIVLSPRIMKDGKQLYHVNICAITNGNLEDIPFNSSQ
jgi:hypothetical protein